MPSARWKNPPLVYVVTQVTFGSVEKIQDYVPDIQEILREIYPRFTMKTVNQWDVHPSEEGLKVETKAIDQWQFHNVDATAGFVLTKNSLAFETATYSTFDELKTHYIDILSKVIDILKINLIERVGLRYVNLLTETADLPLRSQVSENLLGISLTSHTEDHIQVEQKWITRIDANADQVLQGHLLLRFFHVRDGGVLKGWVDSFGLALSKHPERNTPSAVLDIDHFRSYLPQETQPLPDEIAQLLDKYHEEIEKAFLTSLTDSAKEWYKEGGDDVF